MSMTCDDSRWYVRGLCTTTCNSGCRFERPTISRMERGVVTTNDGVETFGRSLLLIAVVLGTRVGVGCMISRRPVGTVERTQR